MIDPIKVIRDFEQADHIMQDQRAEIDRLKEAIRRLADQDATLSVQGGNVIVDMDATLTDAEREAIRWAEREAQAFAEIEMSGSSHGETLAATLRGLLTRLGGTSG